jgi:hypothetical protein
MERYAIDKLVERLRQSRTARDRELLESAGSPLCPEGRMGCTYTAGVRVFDRVSGQEGTVLGARRETVVVSTPERDDR